MENQDDRNTKDMLPPDSSNPDIPCTEDNGKVLKEIGEWSVKQIGEKQILLDLPDGMRIEEGEDLTIEDLLAGIANYLVARQSPVLACCSKKVMVA